MREYSPSSPRSLGTPPPQPRAPAETRLDSAPAGAADERHLHRIAVETGKEPVFVTIGKSPAARTASVQDGGGTGHAAIPGGFAKFFNRVIDCGVWAVLPDAARSVYVPMVRFADGRDAFRVRIGLAALMRHTRLSRSSVKRALRSLLDARLIAIVRAGGVAPDGTNRTNVYQLLLPEPADPGLPPPSAPARHPGDQRPAVTDLAQRSAQSAARAKRGRANEPKIQPEAPPPARRPADELAFPIPSLASPTISFSLTSWGESAPSLGSHPDPLPVPAWSPTPRLAEPPSGPLPVPAPGQATNPAGGPQPPWPEATAEPLQRGHPSYLHLEADDAEVDELLDAMQEEAPRPLLPSSESRQAIELLARWGVDQTVAADIAAAHSLREIQAAADLARQARARGRLRNPAGYIIRCLEESWESAQVSGARQGGAPDAAAIATLDRRTQEEQARAARALADARLDDLDDQTLAHLASRVLALHADRPAMLRLLEARPPRDSRLMRAEIAALLEV